MKETNEIMMENVSHFLSMIFLDGPQRWHTTAELFGIENSILMYFFGSEMWIVFFIGGRRWIFDGQFEGFFTAGLLIFLWIPCGDEWFIVGFLRRFLSWIWWKSDAMFRKSFPNWIFKRSSWTIPTQHRKYYFKRRF